MARPIDPHLEPEPIPEGEQPTCAACGERITQRPFRRVEAWDMLAKCGFAEYKANRSVTDYHADCLPAAGQLGPEQRKFLRDLSRALMPRPGDK